jgi:acyl-CoA synthetase (AMP-forming)/AMP-acid ligase II
MRTKRGRRLPLVLLQNRDTCFLQFTSGSTGESKGVIISQGGLIHNVKLMHSEYKSTSKTVLVSWLPQYHDMGLIGGLFSALICGGTAVLFSPTTFIRKPMLWLDAMDRYKCTHSAGPNFAFELIVKRYQQLQLLGKSPKYDLSSLRFLMASAEPLRYKSMQHFLELLHSSGMREQVLAPAYGLAENCVFVCVAHGKKKPIYMDWQGRVCCWYAIKGDKDVDIRIADPKTFEEKVAGVEGEIWVSSPSMGVGYWGLEELSQQTFCNKLCKADADDQHRKFLRTLED